MKDSKRRSESLRHRVACLSQKEKGTTTYCIAQMTLSYSCHDLFLNHSVNAKRAQRGHKNVSCPQHMIWR